MNKHILLSSIIALSFLLSNTVDAKEISQMSVEEKVGQLFLVRPEALNGAKSLEELHDSKHSVLKTTERMKKNFEKYPVGGIILFSKNLQDPDQTKSFIKSMQEKSRIPLFIAVDEEGGRVARIANNPLMQVKEIPSMKTVKSEEQAYEIGKTIGINLNNLGFNMDFAPVADVLVNPDNTTIGSRSFGNNPYCCGNFAASVAKGLHKENIISCVKHFPGHGGYEKDSHLGISVSYRTLEQIKQKELVAFDLALAEGSDCVMVAHMIWPKINKSGLPASLDSYFYKELLRGKLGFKGVTVTDALEMSAVSLPYGNGKSSLMAFNAGADILLMPDNLRKAYKTVVKAVKKGDISQSRLDASVKRIMQLKEKIKLL